MEIKLIIVKRKKLLRYIKLSCFAFTTLSIWGAVIIQGYVRTTLSDNIFSFGLICWLTWWILFKNFTDYYQIGELFINPDSIKIIAKNDSEVVIKQNEIIQSRFIYKNFKKKYEKNNSSVDDQMSSTHNINRIKIKTKDNFYSHHFYLDYSNHFDELYSIIKTMEVNGVDIKILEGSNLWTKYLQEGET